MLSSSGNKVYAICAKIQINTLIFYANCGTFFSNINMYLCQKYKSNKSTIYFSDLTVYDYYFLKYISKDFDSYCQLARCYIPCIKFTYVYFVSICKKNSHLILGMQKQV